MSVAFLFPGQGSQHVGMGQDLYQVEPASRAVFDQADDLLGFSLSELCFNGPEERLTDTVNQQPALLATSVATLKAMEARDWPLPDFVAGHSLGEFSALVAAESLTFADGLALVRRRGELMRDAGQREPGGRWAAGPRRQGRFPVHVNVQVIDLWPSCHRRGGIKRRVTSIA